jgi:hypothetical protein
MSDLLPPQKPSNQTSEHKEVEGVPVKILFSADLSPENKSPKTFSYDAVLFSASNQSLPTDCPVYLNEGGSEGWTTIDSSGGKEKIWFCGKEDIGSINSVAKLSEKNRAAAIIVVKKPEELIHVPVIVLSLMDTDSFPSIIDGRYRATVNRCEDTQLSENTEKSMLSKIGEGLKTGVVMLSSALGLSEEPPTDKCSFRQATIGHWRMFIHSKLPCSFFLKHVIGLRLP